MWKRAFINGRIHTLDPAMPVAEGVYIEDGVIRQVGTSDQISALCPDAEDLKGRTVIPGFNDSHLHLLSYGGAVSRMDLRGCAGPEDVIRAGRERLERERPEVLWLVGFISPYQVSRTDLDRISAEIPVFYSRVNGHTFAPEASILTKLCCNSAALKRAGLPLGDGFLRGDDAAKVYHMLPMLTRQEKKEALAAAAGLLSAQGFTSVHSNDMVDGDREMLEIVRELGQEGRLPLRMSMQCLFHTRDGLEAFLAEDPRPDFNSDRHRIGAVKLILDGVLGDHTSALKQPYADQPDHQGVLLFSPQELEGIIETAHAHDLPVVIHTIGDRAIQTALDAFGAVRDRLGGRGLRHGLNHCLVLDRQMLHRMKELDLAALIQPIAAVSDRSVIPARFEGGLHSPAYGWKSMLEEGLLVAGGTDCPCEDPNPFASLAAAVTRRAPADSPDKAFLPEERLTLEEALRIMTVNSAYLDHEEGKKGTLTPGKWADLIVLSQDIFAAAPEELPATRCLATVVGGKTVYQAAEW